MKPIRVSEVSAFIKGNPDVQLIDVRSVQEFNAGAIDGFINLPLDQLMHDTSPVSLEKPVIVMCHSGSRSLIACRLLEMAGHETVFNLAGGYMAF